MTTSAEFKITGTTTPESLYADRGFDAAHSETLSFELEAASLPDVRKIQYSVLYASAGAPALSFSNSGLADPLTDPVTATLTGSGTHAYLIQCQINDGKRDDSDETTVAAWTKRRVVVIRSPKGLRKITAGEREDYATAADGAWAEAYNEMAEYLDTAIGILSGTVLANSLQIQGDLVVDDAVTFSNEVADTIAAQQDDYAPTGIAAAAILAITLTGDQTITGIAASQATGRLIAIVNVDTDDDLTLSHEDAASTAANRFNCGYGIDVVIPPRSAALLEYRGSRWHVIGGEPARTRIRGGLHAPDLITASITGDQNDWNPSGIEDATEVRISNGASAPVTITGIDAGQVNGEGRRLRLRSNSSAWPIRLTYNDSASLSANRIYCPNKQDIIIPELGTVDLSYDGSKWYVDQVPDNRWDISVTIATGTYNDYTPTNGEFARIIHLSPNTGAVTLTGLALGNHAEGQRVTLVNRGVNNITLNHLDGGSSAANRFMCPNQANYVLNDLSAIDLQYSGGDSRWMILGPVA